MADDAHIKLEHDDDIMKFINIGEEVGSELDFSEDGGSSIASSAEFRFDPSDNFEFEGTEFDYSWMSASLTRDNPLCAPVDMRMTRNTSELNVNQAPMAMQTKPIFPEMSTCAQDLMQKIKFGAFDTPGYLLEAPKPEMSFKEFNEIPNADLEYSLKIEQFPSRSRVETQIKCRLSMQRIKPSNLPTETLLHLPTDTIARPRFQLMNPDQLHSDETLRNQVLWLTVEAFNPDVPNEHVLMCAKCLARERRRAFRKKAMDPHEETYWNSLKARRIIIFNCREVVPISPVGQVELPLRIACYCRHHAAKNGYQLFFALQNHEGKILGKAVSSKVLITDSHKDQRRLSSTHSLTSPTDSLPATPSSVSSSVDSMPLSTPHMRRVSSASSIGMQSQLQQVPMSQQMVQHPQVLQNQHHPYMRPVKPSQSPSQPVMGFGVVNGSGLGGLQQVPNCHLSSQIQKLHAVPSWLAGVQLNDNSTPAQQFPGTQQQMQHHALPQQQAHQQSAPVVFKVIPHMGSVRGGIEVTLLGQNFQPGLVAMFGDARSINTQCWSNSTIIAQLPPSSQLGSVPVTFLGEVTPAGSPASFTYINDGEDKLKEIALQMVGYKCTGKIEDASDIAQRIIMNDHNKDQSQGQGANGGSMSGNSSAPHNCYSDNITDSAEQLSLWVLRSLNKIGPGRVANVNLRNSEGQTMMHIAAMLGYASVVKALIVHGAYVDIQDVSGYTPLHMAVLSGNRNTSRLLLMADADPFNRTLHGLTALDLADVTVEDLLPKDQRSWYNELNRRGSSSSIASMIEEWRQEVPDARLETNYKAYSNNNGLVTALDANEPHALRKPPSYSKLFPTDGTTDSVSSTAGDESSPPSHGANLESDGVTSNQKQMANHSNRENTRVPIIDIEISSADDDDDEDAESSDLEEQISKSATEDLNSVANDAPLGTKVDEKRRNNEIWNDRMLFTFWIPLSLVTLIGIFAIYIIRGFGSEGTHPLATKIGDMVVNFCTSALDKMIPMPRWNQTPAHAARIG